MVGVEKLTIISKDDIQGDAMDNLNESNVIDLVAAQKPEDVKVIVTGMLNDRLRDAISEAREGMEGSMSGGMGHIQKDEKKSGGKVASDPKATNPGDKGHEQSNEKKKGSKTASDPKATNPGAMGHIQKDEKKSGGKVASDPKASGGGKKEIPDSMAK